MRAGVREQVCPHQGRDHHNARPLLVGSTHAGALPVALACLGSLHQLYSRSQSLLALRYVCSIFECSRSAYPTLTGNLKDFVYQKNVGDMDFQFMKQYGRVWRMRSPLGVSDAHVLRGNLLK